MKPSDLTVEVFLVLRKTFFDEDGKALPFSLRDKEYPRRSCRRVFAAGFSGGIGGCKMP